MRAILARVITTRDNGQSGRASMIPQGNRHIPDLAIDPQLHYLARDRREGVKKFLRDARLPQQVTTSKGESSLAQEDHFYRQLLGEPTDQRRHSPPADKWRYGFSSAPVRVCKEASLRICRSSPSIDRGLTGRLRILVWNIPRPSDSKPHPKSAVHSCPVIPRECVRGYTASIRPLREIFRSASA